jgi:hypothetical protein
MAYEYLYPTSDVLTGLTPSTGSDGYAMVDDPQGAPDDDSTYNAFSGSSSLTNTYRLTAWSLGNKNIIAVSVFIRGKTTSGTTSHQANLLLGESEEVGTPISGVGGYNDNSYEDFDRPGGGSWSYTDMDNIVLKELIAHAGGKGISEGRNTAVHVRVQYSDPVGGGEISEDTGVVGTPDGPANVGGPGGPGNVGGPGQP